SPASASRRRRRSRRCAITSTSTGISCSPTILGRASPSSTASRFPRTNQDSVSEKKYLILAEGFSDDVHYGKTLRGVMRYRRESVVAILDTQRAGESDDGVPIVATVDEGMQHGPSAALVGVVTQGGRFPGDWQELLKSCVEKGLDLENGLHVRLHDIPGLPELAEKHRVALRDLREPPPDLSTATGENLQADATIVLTVGSDCSIGQMTATCELDREARR